MPPAPDLTQAVDVASALERLSGNTDLYARVLKDYLSLIASLPDQLDAMLRDNDLPAAARLLHTLKGLSATVGANHLSDVAREAETRVKSADANAPLQRITLLPAFRKAVASTERVMGDIARQLPQAATPASTGATAPRLDRAQCLTELQELQHLLKRANMRAVDVHAQLNPLLAQTAPQEFSQLSAAMRALDFAQAVVQCEVLVQKLRLQS